MPAPTVSVMVKSGICVYSLLDDQTPRARQRRVVRRRLGHVQVQEKPADSAKRPALVGRSAVVTHIGDRGRAAGRLAHRHAVKSTSAGRRHRCVAAAAQHPGPVTAKRIRCLLLPVGGTGPGAHGCAATFATLRAAGTCQMVAIGSDPSLPRLITKPLSCKAAGGQACSDHT